MLSRPPLGGNAGRRSTSPEICRVDKHGSRCGLLDHYLREDPLIARQLLPAVERLVSTIGGGNITPTQATEIDQK